MTQPSASSGLACMRSASFCTSVAICSLLMSCDAPWPSPPAATCPGTWLMASGAPVNE